MKSGSESEEMYLVTLARLVEAGFETPIPLSQLASELSIQPVSANQMIRKLEETGQVSYTPYKGAALTPAGELTAMRILRRRRLWEVFLVEILQVAPDEADELACRLEHILPAEVVEQLAGFLGSPVTSPRGMPIPSLIPDLPLHADTLLSQLPAGEQGQISRVETDTATRTFLFHEGLQPGSSIRVLGLGSNGATLVSADGRSVFLAGEVAGKVWVKTLAQLTPEENRNHHSENPPDTDAGHIADS